MAQIIGSPYKPDTTLGDTLGGLGEAFFGPKASQSALVREKFLEQKRQNEAIPLLSQAINAGDQSGIVTHGLAAGLDPKNPLGYYAGKQINTSTDIMDPRNSAAAFAAGHSWGATPAGAQLQLEKQAATEIAKQNLVIQADELKNQRELVPVLDPTSPQGYKTVTKAEFLSKPGIYTQVAPQDVSKSALGGQGYATGFKDLNPQQQKYTGALVPPDHILNWIAPPLEPGGPPRQGTTVDGKSDITTGQPLPAGHQVYGSNSAGGANAMSGALGPTTRSSIDEAVIHGEDALKLSKQLIGMAKNDPKVIGATGNILRLGQNAADVAKSIHSMFGGEAQYNAEVDKARAVARQYLGADADRLLPALYSGDLNSVPTLHALLTYKYARALNNGALATKDVTHMNKVLGDPTGWLQSPTGFINSMTAAQGQLERELADNYRRRDAGRADVNRPKPGAAPPPATAAPAVKLDAETEALVNMYGGGGTP